MKRFRLAVLAAVLALTGLAGTMPSQKALACTGDPCDGICLFWEQHHEIFEKLHLGRHCGLG